MSAPDTDSVIRHRALLPVPWRNGGGITREITARELDGGGGHAWRLSLAVIDEAGPFSRFPGTQRIFTVVTGGPVALTVSGRQHRVTSGTPFGFPGDASVRADLLGGPLEVLNVIADPAAVSASVSVEEMRRGRACRVGPHQCAVLLWGRATLAADGAEHPVGALDTVDRHERTAAELTGEGLVAVVSLHPAGRGPTP